MASLLLRDAIFFVTVVSAAVAPPRRSSSRLIFFLLPPRMMPYGGARSSRALTPRMMMAEAAEHLDGLSISGRPEEGARANRIID